MQKIKKTSHNTILWWLTLITVFYMNLVIGSPATDTPKLLYIIINIIMIGVIIDAFQTKTKLKITKIDIIVALLALTTFVPIIFRTSVSMLNATNGVIKYLVMLELYGIIKYMLNVGEEEKEKRIGQIINVIIISSIFLIIFGIDTMTYNAFGFIYKLIDKVEIVNSSNIRMDSLFEYPNTFALWISISLFLTLGKLIKNSKSNIFNICLFLQIFAIVASGSRLVLILDIIFIVVYFIIVHKKVKIGIIITQLIILTGLAIGYYAIYQNLLVQGENLYIYITLLLILGVIVLLTQIGNRWKEKNKVIEWKKIIYPMVIIVGIGVIAVLIDIIINTELVLFTNSNSQNRQLKKIYHIETNQNYEFTFLVEAKNKEETKDNFKINVKQYDRQEKQIAEEYIYFDDYEGEKTIGVTTKEDAEYIVILFDCKELDKSEYLKIKECKMNGKTLALNYKIIPYSMVERIKSISSNNKSVYERFIFIKDAGKLIKDNWMFGLGENAWKYLYKTVRSYDYGAVQLHSYPISLWLQFGIIAFALYVYLIYLIARKIIRIGKETEIEKIGIALALLILILHSFLDFDVDFVSILFTMFCFIGILDVGEKAVFQKDITKSKMIIMVIITSILAIGNIGTYVADKIDKIDKTNLSVEQRITLANIKKTMAPLDYNYKLEYASALSSYRVLNREEIHTEKYQKRIKVAIKNLEYAIKTEPLESRYDLYTNLCNNYLEGIEEDKRNLEKFEELYQNYVLKSDNKLTQLNMHESFMVTLEYQLNGNKEIEELYQRIQKNYEEIKESQEKEFEEEYIDYYSQVSKSEGQKK